MPASRKSLRIKDYAKENRPRERMRTDGVESLSNGELLAVLLGTGLPGENAVELSNNLLAKYQGFKGILRADLNLLQSEPGIGPAKASRIKSALEIASRLVREEKSKSDLIKNPADVVDLIGYEMRVKTQEELWLLLLNSRHQLIRRVRLYRGSQDASTVKVGEVFQQAMLSQAHSLILVHNHPSGDASESPDDVALTQSVVDAGKLLDLPVVDHIIIGLNNYTSIKRNHPSIWA